MNTKGSWITEWPHSMLIFRATYCHLFTSSQLKTSCLEFFSQSSYINISLDMILLWEKKIKDDPCWIPSEVDLFFSGSVFHLQTLLEPAIEPTTFWLLDNLINLLRHSHHLIVLWSKPTALSQWISHIFTIRTFRLLHGKVFVKTWAPSQ